MFGFINRTPGKQESPRQKLSLTFPSTEEEEEEEEASSLNPQKKEGGGRKKAAVAAAAIPLRAASLVGSHLKVACSMAVA